MDGCVMAYHYEIPGGILSYKLFDICTQHVKHVHNMSSLAGRANKLSSVSTHILPAGFTSFLLNTLHLKAQIFSSEHAECFLFIRAAIHNAENAVLEICYQPTDLS